MQSQFVVTPYPQPITPPPPSDPAAYLGDLLRQILEVQRQQLAQMQAQAQAHDPSGKWRNLLNRWRQDYPELPGACRAALPVLEKVYGFMLNSLLDEVRQNGEDAFESEYTLQEFLDRYGMRLGQMGNILHVVGPLAEIAAQSEAAPTQQ